MVFFLFTSREDKISSKRLLLANVDKDGLIFDKEALEIFYRKDKFNLHFMPLKGK